MSAVSARVDAAASGASAPPSQPMKNKADSNYLLTARADPNQFKSGSIFALGLGVILLLFPSHSLWILARLGFATSKYQVKVVASIAFLIGFFFLFQFVRAAAAVATLSSRKPTPKDISANKGAAPAVFSTQSVNTLTSPVPATPPPISIKPRAETLLSGEKYFLSPSTGGLRSRSTATSSAVNADFRSPLRAKLLDDRVVTSEDDVSRQLGQRGSSNQTSALALVDINQNVPLFSDRVNTLAVNMSSADSNGLWVVSGKALAEVKAPMVDLLSTSTTDDQWKDVAMQLMQTTLRDYDTRMRDLQVQLKHNVHQYIKLIVNRLDQNDRDIEFYRAGLDAVIRQNNANCLLPNRQSVMQLSTGEKAALQSGEFSCVSLYYDEIVNFMLNYSTQFDPLQAEWIKRFNKTADDRRALQHYFRVGKDADRARDGKPQECVNEAHVISRLRAMAQDVSLELACSGLPSVLINGDVAPTDAQIVMHMMFTEMDDNCVPKSRSRFALRYLVSFSDELDRRSLSHACVVQIKRNPTFFVVVAGQHKPADTVWAPEPGRNAVFKSMMLFALYLKLNAQSKLDDVALSKSNLIGFMF